jgi:hypothetical protein
MKTIAGIPVFELEFDKAGKLFAAAQLTELTAHLQSAVATDLVMFAHGWNNDMADARKLYTNLFTELGAFTQGAQPQGIAERKLVGAVVLWPSKKFTDEELIPGGGAAALGSREKTIIRARLKDLAKDQVRLGKATPVSAAKAKKIAKADALLKTVESDPKAQEEFVKVVRSLLSDKAAHADDGTKDLFKLSERQLLDNLKQPVLVTATPGEGGAAGFSTLSGGDTGGAADLGDSILSGIRRLMNMTTYYQMKERAGTVGVSGVAPVIRKLRQKLPALRLHLTGHSFGGRVMTAAVDAAGGVDKIDSLTLLQAAYSHNGLATKFDGKSDGFFRKVVTGKKVRGPILITCTKNDKAVGIAYPLASRLGGQNAAAFGDENDPYGGIGRNGAVKTPEAVKGLLQAANAGYQFVGGSIYNLNADAVITDHSDICKPQVAWAMACSIATT